MCMTYFPDGRLMFAGGFTFYNPSRWRYDAETKELEIILGGISQFPVGSAKYQIAHRPGSLLRFDVKKRALVYSLLPHINSPRLEFAGFIFYYGRPCEGAN